MELVLTDSALSRAKLWLHAAALGDQINVETYMPKLTAHVDLYLDRDGSWSRGLDEASLDTARAMAESALGNALRELARLRIMSAGRPDGTDAELDARLADAAGMPLDRYFAEYGPRLLPAADELRAQYDGSGSYQIEGVHIRFDGLDDARYLADDALLVLEFTDRTEVYRRA